LTTANFLSDFAQKSADIPWQITMEPYKANRTRAQNALMWMWHTAWAAEVGETKEYAHERFKHRHVLPILLRDDEEGKLTELHTAAKTNKRMMAALVNILSTTHLTTAQFTEALEEYDRATAARGLCFPHPEDQYREAMGR
jgi:hypothetical protein